MNVVTGRVATQQRYLPCAQGVLRDPQGVLREGETRYTSGTTPTARHYTGQYEESGIGLYFYNARWYDPVLGRFAQADTLIPQPGSPLAWDRYAYVQNSPVNFNDPSGHCIGPLLLACLVVANFIIDNAAIISAVAITSAIVIPWVGPSTPDPRSFDTPTTPDDLINHAGESILFYSAIMLPVDMAFTALPQSKTPNVPAQNDQVHGNNKTSPKLQTGYEIFERETGDVVKTGISGVPAKDGNLPRANSQIRIWNRDAGFDKYNFRIIEENIPGRQAALDWEKANTQRLYNEGQSLSRHQLPKPR